MEPLLPVLQIDRTPLPPLLFHGEGIAPPRSPGTPQGHSLFFGRPLSASDAGRNGIALSVAERNVVQIKEPSDWIVAIEPRLHVLNAERLPCHSFAAAPAEVSGLFNELEENVFHKLMGGCSAVHAKLGVLFCGRPD
jgi:hypothetical protein